MNIFSKKMNCMLFSIILFASDAFNENIGLRTRRIIVGSPGIQVVSDKMLWFGDSLNATQRTLPPEFPESLIVDPIILNLGVPKKRFSLEEKIKIKVFLENQTHNQTYLIARNISSFFVITPYQGIYVSIIDKNGRDVAPRVFPSLPANTPQITLDDIMNWYLKLSPGMIYGHSESFDLNLPIGTYQLIAKYYDSAVTRWSEEERRTISLPVWRKEIISKPVEIIITR